MAILRSSSSPSPLPLSDCGATEKNLSMCVPGGSKQSSSLKSKGFAAKKKHDKEKIVEKGKAVEDDRVVKRVRKCASLDSDSEDELDMDIFNGAKLWEFYFKPEDKLIGKITFYPNSRVDFIEVIKKKLTSKQLVLFRETYFGHFLDMSTVTMQAQLIHASLYRKVHQNNEREIWFRFGNDTVRFSVAEFGLISGLKCTGDRDYSKYVNSTNEFAVRYFYDQTVTYGGVVSRFLSSNFKDHGFAVKMVVLYFVTNCLLCRGEDKKVHAGLLNLIDSGEFNSYPWGKLSYDYTFHGLRLKAVPMEQTDAEKDFHAQEVVKGQSSGVQNIPEKVAKDVLEEKDLLDLSEFEWYGLSVSDDDFVGPAMPKKLVKGQSSGVQNIPEKVAKDVLEGVSNRILKDMKDSLAVISNHQKTVVDAGFLEVKKTIEEKFLEFEKSIKSYIDYFDPESKDDEKVKEQDTAVTEDIVVQSENVDANVGVAGENMDSVVNFNKSGGGFGGDTGVIEKSGNLDSLVKNQLGDGGCGGESSMIEKGDEACGGESSLIGKENVGVVVDSNIAQDVDQVNAEDDLVQMNSNDYCPSFNLMKLINEPQLFNDDAPVEFDDGGQVGDKGGDDVGVADKKAMGSQATDDNITSFVMGIINEKMDDIEKEKSNQKKSNAKDKVLDVQPIRSFGSPSVGVSKELREMKGQFVFSSGLMDVPLCVHQDAFDEWFSIGYRPGNVCSLFIFRAVVTNPDSGVHGSGNNLIFAGSSNLYSFAAFCNLHALAPSLVLANALAVSLEWELQIFINIENPTT
ncbi:hypothetical protein G4B88_001243 [Cannabis sativa]|uniref:DUF1985 domain-containing protein n=1 Tax=Cannabis sativa TaxID=3483 RepID=A0A7J6I124_CANSA|nr:hypothetical protein G4B88_001243 [Cannabis sativa]